MTEPPVVAKILQHHALSPTLDTLDLSRVVSIALGQDVSEAFVIRVLSDHRERSRESKAWLEARKRGSGLA